MKAVLICGGIIAVLAVVVIAAHAKRVCKYATIFLDHY